MLDIRALAAPTLDDRILVVAAHPGEETVGAGGLLCRAGDPWIVTVTDGVARDASQRDTHKRQRRAELLAALERAAIGVDRTFALPYAAGEATDSLERATRDLEGVIEFVAPMWIVTHAYEGLNGDADATAMATWAACARVERRGLTAPKRVEMLYRAGGVSTTSIRVEHSAALRTRKRSMVEAFASQAGALASFTVDCETFREAPPYEFDIEPRSTSKLTKLEPPAA